MKSRATRWTADGGPNENDPATAVSVSLAMWFGFVLAALAIVAVVGCDRSASDRPTEKTVAERAEAAAAPKPSAGSVSSNDKVTDAAAAKARE